MKLRNCIAVSLSCYIVLLAASCKKGSMPTNLSTTKIAKVDKNESNGSRYHYYITYDAYNNVDSIGIIGGGTDTGYLDYEKFTYVGSSFLVNDYQNGQVTVDANTNGQIIKILLSDTMSLTYNGSELTEIQYKQPSINPPYYVVDSGIYEWDNGDLKGYKFDTGVVDSYYYDLSRAGQTGDALRIGQFLQYGRAYVLTLHLPDELSYNGRWLEEDLYSFDDKGRISVLSRVANGGSGVDDTTTYTYTYY